MASSITGYHAIYFAHSLSRRCGSGDLEKFAGALIDSPQVHLNPHQVSAALFAFKSPLSRGAILADEVGLGKTIEAGILIAQKWAERKRKILIIVPASLRMQWSQELAEKFYLSSEILDGRSFDKARWSGSENPFDKSTIVLCSYQFAANKSELISRIGWDLVVIDEAHRLRNVYKKGNQIARTLRDALCDVPKVLLTATPLQNSLLELYGLVSFIDPYVFGDQKSFRRRYSNLSTESFADLKERLAPICQRTLRRQVLPYIKYTQRISMVQAFTPTQKEKKLYDLVSNYLREGNLVFHHGMSELMTLLMRKLLASSSFAIAGTLDSFIRVLKAKLNSMVFGQNGAPIEIDFDYLDSGIDEWEDDAISMESLGGLTAENIRMEIAEVMRMRNFAVSIKENAKGQALLGALKAGFDKVHSFNGAEKAIIFTESRRTQKYLLQLLRKNGYADHIVLFNGTNDDPVSRKIYETWKMRHTGRERVTGSRSVDVKAALVEYFRDDAKVMIATEAAAEGVNLQFCNLVVNYDLPWNPQRVEQRIGRCHRYGQRHDVVVVNFLNEGNAADRRVYTLLKEKFKLFDGVFGASDEILGVLQGGADFERRILGIYQSCRHEGEINAAFDKLQKEFDYRIDTAMKATRKQLLENFDSEVIDRLKVGYELSKECLNRYEAQLLKLTQFVLTDVAEFEESQPAFSLLENPFPGESISVGRYKIGKPIEDALVYRISHHLAQCILKHAMALEMPFNRLIFDLMGCSQRVAILNDLVGKSGQLSLTKLSVESANTEDHLVWAAITDDGIVLDRDQCVRLFTVLPCCIEPATEVPRDLSELTESEIQKVLARTAEQNARYFEAEIGKLDRWADDRKRGLQIRIKEAFSEIRHLKKESRLKMRLADRLRVEQTIKKHERKLTELRSDFFASQDAIEKRKDGILDSAQLQLKQSSQSEHLFSVQFSII